MILKQFIPCAKCGTHWMRIKSVPSELEGPVRSVYCKDCRGFDEFHDKETQIIDTINWR